MQLRTLAHFRLLIAFAVVVMSAAPDASAQVSRFDFNRTEDGGSLEQPGWTHLAATQGGTDAPIGVTDGLTGFGVNLISETFLPAAIARDRGDYNSTLGGTFTLDDVYIDWIGALDRARLSNLSPTDTYDVQFIMFDDNSPNPRTQTVTNITGGGSTLLGDVTWPAAAGASLTSDTDFSVIGTSLTPDPNGNLDFFFTNSVTGDRSLVNGVVISGGPGGTDTALFDLGLDNGEEQQPGWNAMEIVDFSTSFPDFTDVGTGINLQVFTPPESSVIARNRSPYSNAPGGSFTLDDVYIDMILGIEDVEVTGLDPSKLYEISFIMFDDNVTDSRVQAVFNTTSGLDDFVGVGTGPGVGGSSTLTSDTDFQVVTPGLSPDPNGVLSFRLENTATGNRSLLNGMIITEVIPEPSTALLFSIAGLLSVSRRKK